MASVLCDQRKRCVQALAWHFNLRRSFVMRGEYGHAGPAAPYLHEAYIDICSILLYVGDVFGYIVLDDDSVVDPRSSNGPFVELFVQCLELMHEWCIRHPPFGQTECRMWSTCGLHSNVLLEVEPSLRFRMLDAVYPHVTEGTIIPEGALLLPDVELRDMFLEKSKSAFELAELDSQLQFQPLRSPSNIQSLRVYLSQRRVEQTVPDAGLALGDCLDIKNGNVLSLRLVRSSESARRGVVKDWQFYWSLYSFDRSQTIYDDVISILQME